MNQDQLDRTDAGGAAGSPPLDSGQREVLEAYRCLADALSGPQNGYDVLTRPDHPGVDVDYGAPGDWTTLAQTGDEGTGSPTADPKDDAVVKQVRGLPPPERTAVLRHASGDPDGLVARSWRSSGTDFLEGLSPRQVADVLGGLDGGPVAGELGRSMARTDPRRTAEVVAVMEREPAVAFVRTVADVDPDAAGTVLCALAEQGRDESDRRVLHLAGDRPDAAPPADGVRCFDRLGTQDLRRILYSAESASICLAVVHELGRDGVVRLLEFDPPSVASLLTRAGDVPTTARVLADLKADHAVQVLAEMTDDEAADHLRHVPPALRSALLRRVGPPRSTALTKKLQQ